MRCRAKRGTRAGESSKLSGNAALSSILASMDRVLEPRPVFLTRVGFGCFSHCFFILFFPLSGQFQIFESVVQPVPLPAVSAPHTVDDALHRPLFRLGASLWPFARGTLCSIRHFDLVIILDVKSSYQQAYCHGRSVVIFTLIHIVMVHCICSVRAFLWRERALPWTALNPVLACCLLRVGYRQHCVLFGSSEVPRGLHLSLGTSSYVTVALMGAHQDFTIRKDDDDEQEEEGRGRE